MFRELHREKKREEEDRGDQEERRGVKRTETKMASNQFCKCSPKPRTPENIHRVK